MAREQQPSIVIIDDLDALGGRPDEYVPRVKTEFLVQMAGVLNSNIGVYVITTCSRPWELDQCLLRRYKITSLIRIHPFRSLPPPVY